MNSIIGNSNVLVSDSAIPYNHICVERFKTLFHELNANNCHLSMFEHVYSNEVSFTDSFHNIYGVANLHHYCQNLYQNVNHCRFTFEHELVQHGSAFLTWNMNFSHPRLKSGADIKVDGCTQLKFSDKIHYHRDYFDAGQMLYENVPLVGNVVRAIKARLG